MNQYNQEVRPCFICKTKPINRLCLADEVIQNNKYLFCDSCRKNQLLRRHASEIYQIDQYSGPVSLFSINYTNKEQAKIVIQNVNNCKESAQTNIGKIYDILRLIDSKIVQKLFQLQSTFDSQRSSDIERLFKNAPFSYHQSILQKIKTLKWFRQNKQLISNASLLSQKLTTFANDFDKNLIILSTKIQTSIQQFLAQFNMDDFFKDKKRQISDFKQKQFNNGANKNVKKNKSNDRNQNNKQPLAELDNKILQKKNELFKQKQIFPQQKIQFEHQNFNEKLMKITKSIQIKEQSLDQKIQRKYIFPLNSNIKEDLNDGLQKQSIQMRQIQNVQTKLVKKKPSKPVGSRQQVGTSEQQIKVPKVVLQKIPTKQDYLQQQKLIINLKNIAQVFWLLRENEQKTPLPAKQSAKIKYEPIIERIVEEGNNSRDFRDNINVQARINLQKIKYLQVQQLPRRSIQVFNITMNGKSTKIKYSLETLYQKMQKMQKLQQLHVFVSWLFPSQVHLRTTLLFCPYLKVITFSCYNPVQKMLAQYKNMIGNQVNEELQILQTAVNIPFCQNIQMADLKIYFPQSQKNKKIYDQYFAKNVQKCVQEEKKSIEQEINQKQKFQNKNSCWFIPKQLKSVQKERMPVIMSPTDNKLMAQCFKSLRNCWVPYLKAQYLTEQQQIMQLQKIQHLNLGFHYFILQPIPQSFFYGEKAFLKSLTNLKSINLINLNINEFFMIKTMSKQMSEVISLKIQNCMGLKDQFYSNLPKSCPKLRKLSVNNLESGINGDFIIKFQQLQTLILPWSQLSYKRSQKFNDTENNIELIKRQQQEINFIIVEQTQNINYRKLKYINLYGCKWLSPDFFSLISLEKLQHLNIGNCTQIRIGDLIFYLKMCQNLQSLCMDYLHMDNQELFKILRILKNLNRLSLAHCPNLNFTFGNLELDQIQLLDQMTHLDIRNKYYPIAFQYTMKMINPKHLVISRPFQLDQNQPEVLAQRQIYAHSSPS